MSDAATNIQVPFVPQAAPEGDDSAVLPTPEAAAPVIRPDRPAAPTAGPAGPRTGDWDEPDLPDADEADDQPTPTAGGGPAAPSAPAGPVILLGDERPTMEHPAVVDERAEAREVERPAPQPAPENQASTPDGPAAAEPGPVEQGPAEPEPATPAVAPVPEPERAPGAPSPVPVPQQPQQWHGGPNGFAPHPGVQQPTFGPGPQNGQFPGQHVPGQLHRPPMPQPFGHNGVPQQGIPAAAQHMQAPMRPMGEQPSPMSAPMSTASSSFNQQIRFSDSAVRVKGWRAWLKWIGLDVGPSAGEQEHAELVHRIRVPKHRFHVTSVFADNAGGTLLVGVLGQILERTRADNVVALDLDPDGGDLDQVTAWHQGGSTARTLIQQSDLSDRNQVDKHLAVTATNMHVLPTPWRFNGRDFADYDDVLDLYSIFRPHYSLALVDAGGGLQTQTGTGVLEISSALILPASATTRGVRKVAATIDWLRHHGWHGLLANTIVVINHTKKRSSVSVDQFDELFRAGQKLRVHEIPYDPHLDSDQPIDLDLMRKRTIRAFENLAADLADGFNSGYEPPAAQKLAELQQARTNEGR
ncbi:hypothetical protein GCM10027289_25880 [Tsukamurella serpentis]